MTWGPQPIGDEVLRALGRFGPAGTIAEVVAAWPAAVGEQIARNAWPARVARDGTLHVATASSTWAFELGQLADEIRDRLAAPLGAAAPARLRFAPGRLPEPGMEDVPTLSRSVPGPKPEHREAAAQIAAAIENTALRELVARAAAASLAAADRGPGDRPL